MAESSRRLWRILTRLPEPTEDAPVVLDRRQGERRQQVQPVETERRKGERRHPLEIEATEVNCFLGEGTQLKGELSFRGVLHVEGQIAGAPLRGDLLLVGERGRVHADLEVEIARLRGEVQGNIIARQQVELLGSCRVTGTIRTPCLIIWQGAVFNGTCEMPAPTEAETHP